MRISKEIGKAIIISCGCSYQSKQNSWQNKVHHSFVKKFNKNLGSIAQKYQYFLSVPRCVNDDSTITKFVHFFPKNAERVLKRWGVIIGLESNRLRGLKIFVDSFHSVNCAFLRPSVIV